MVLKSPLRNAMSNLFYALTSNLVPTQEFYLQGSVLEPSLEMLLHRLRGLSDNQDGTDPESFNDYEVSYSMKINGEPPLNVRIRRCLLRKSQPYHLRYMGRSNTGDKSHPTAVRTRLDMMVSSSIIDFLTELGFKKDFEYVTRGFIFGKGRMKAIVSRIFKIKDHKDLTDPACLEPFTDSYYVELSLMSPTSEVAIGHEMKSFADQLKPLVNLEKIDYPTYVNGKHEKLLK